MSPQRRPQLLTIVLFAAVIVGPLIAAESIARLGRAVGETADSQWKLSEIAMGIGLPWKLLVYPHDLASWRQSLLLPGLLAPAVAALHWTIVALGIMSISADWGWKRRTASILLAVVVCGLALQVTCRLARVSFPVE